METLEEYLAKRKHKDHMDEFDLSRHSENMSSAIQDVMDYFNTYLDIETISQEQIKLERATDKLVRLSVIFFPLPFTALLLVLGLCPVLIEDLYERRKWEQERAAEKAEEERRKAQKYKQQIYGLMTTWEQRERANIYVQELRKNLNILPEDQQKKVSEYCELVLSLYAIENQYQDILDFMRNYT